jgi:hypothetical protein
MLEGKDVNIIMMVRSIVDVAAAADVRYVRVF